MDKNDGIISKLIPNKTLNLQPDLNGNPFLCWLSLSKLTQKRLGVEGGLSCPNHGKIKNSFREKRSSVLIIVMFYFLINFIDLPSMFRR